MNLIIYFKNQKVKGYSGRGEILLQLITDNSYIVGEILKGKDSYLVLMLNDKFVSDLTVGCIKLVHLPLFTEPSHITSDGLYYPYIHTDSTNFHCFEGRLI